MCKRKKTCCNKNCWKYSKLENCGCLCVRNPDNNFLGTYSFIGDSNYLVGNYLATGYLDNGHTPNVQLSVRYGYQNFNNFKCNRCITGLFCSGNCGFIK